MNRNVILGIVIVLVLAVLGWWYFAMMQPEAEAPMPQENTSADAGAEAAPSEEAPQLAGVWRSTQDANFVREFRADGTVIDTYEGDDSARTQGSWNFVADPAREQPELPPTDGPVIKIAFSEEVLYFSLLEVTVTDLSLIYLGRGNVLSFTRVN